MNDNERGPDILPPRRPPLPFNPPSDPSTRDSSPAKTASSFDYLSPTAAVDSRRGSQASYNLDSRRGSAVKDAMKDLKKGVKSVTDSTVKAGHKVKDKTAIVSSTVKDATKDASKWVTSQTSKKAKQAMHQAASSLSGSEKFTFFAAEKIKMLSRSGITHLLMFLVLVLYTAIGGAIFYAVEGANNEVVRKINLNEAKFKLVEKVWDEFKVDQTYQDFQMKFQNSMIDYETHVHDYMKSGMDVDTNDQRWTFIKSMFYCATISTTIGYGVNYPTTDLGRILTILYALIGIPLFLILMADFGKLFTRILKNLFILIDKIKKSGTYKRARGHQAVQRVSGRLQVIINILTCNCRKSSQAEARRKKYEVDPEEYFNDGNFNLPVSLALTILLVYILAGAFFFGLWEDWTTFEAFYFIFISMTTIGFGDLHPENPAFMMMCTVYLVFGLALTAMCINVIQEKLTNTFREASAKMKDRFKNIMTSMQAENEDEKEDGDDDVEDDETARRKNAKDFAINVESAE